MHCMAGSCRYLHLSPNLQRPFANISHGVLAISASCSFEGLGFGSASAPGLSCLSFFALSFGLAFALSLGFGFAFAFAFGFTCWNLQLSPNLHVPFLAK